MRNFETGATRDSDHNKNDYEGFLSPLVIEAFGDYMSKHRVQADGKLRDSDNWQKGIPLPAYMKSGFRHFIQWWKLHRCLDCKDEKGNRVTMEDALCAILFNVMGYLHEYLKRRRNAGTQALIQGHFHSGLPSTPTREELESRALRSELADRAINTPTSPERPLND